MLSRCLEHIATALMLLLALLGAVLTGLSLVFYYILIVALMIVVGIGWGIGWLMLRLNNRAKQFMENPGVQAVVVILFLYGLVQLILWKMGLL